MKVYAYLRVSTDKQATDTQEHDLLQKYPAAEVYRETASGVKARPVLDYILTVVEPGDTIAVAAMDRFGRRTSEILTLLESLHKRGVNVISLREGFDYGTPAGKMVVQMMVVVSEMERSLISQRTRAAMQALKARGVKLGRPREFAPEALAEAQRLRTEQKLPYRDIAYLTGVSVGTLHAVLK